MSEPRTRIPGLGAVLFLIVLAVPLVGIVWWVSRPPGGAGQPGPPATELDVVCLGRVDGLKPVIPLEPSVPGKVVAIYAVEGQHVEAGSELLRLDDETPRLRVEEATAAVTAAAVEVEAARQESKRHPLRRDAQKAAVSAAADRVAAARRLLDAKRTAKTFGTVTAAELLAAESEVRQFEQLEEVERARLRELEATDPGLAVRAAEAKETMARVALRLAEKAVRDCTLLAPTAGTVLRVRASPGQSIAPGSPQAPIDFRPEGPLVIRAELEQEFLGRVKEGLKATIHDHARSDSPTWTGTVSAVGRVVAARREVLSEPGEPNDRRTVECIITLDGQTESLLIGQRMRVRILRRE